jgi:hypothetical protein
VNPFGGIGLRSLSLYLIAFSEGEPVSTLGSSPRACFAGKCSEDKNAGLFRGGAPISTSPKNALRETRFGSGFALFFLTCSHFLAANRCPLRWKML